MAQELKLTKNLDEHSNPPDSEKRKSQRRKLYLGEDVKAKFNSLEHAVTGMVLDFGLFGASLAIPEHSRVTLATGEVGLLEIKCRLGTSAPIRCLVKSASVLATKSGNWQRYGLEFDNSQYDPLETSRLQGGSLHKFVSRLQPMVSVIDPFNPPHVLVLRMIACRPHGCTLVTSKRNLSLLAGFEMDFKFLLPMDGEQHCRAKIISTRAFADVDDVDVEVAYLAPTTHFLVAMSRHILMATPEVKLKHLREDGFTLGSSEEAFLVHACSTHREWQDVLNLRLKAYQEVGKFLDRKKCDEMEDPFDGVSRQLVCKLGSKVVGALRIVFPNGQKEHSEHVQIGVPVPEWLFETSFIELSRACTEKSQRNGDVLLLLLRKSFEIFVQEKIQFVLANCNSEMWPLYKKIGFKKTGVRFEAFGRTDCELIVGDVRKLMSGRIGNLFTYHAFFFDVTKRHQNAINDQGFFAKFWSKTLFFVHMLFASKIRKVINKASIKKATKTNFVSRNLKARRPNPSALTEPKSQAAKSQDVENQNTKVA